VQSSNLAIARELYGFNWATVAGRERGLGRMAKMVHAEFEAHLSPEIGGRVVHGIAELRQFGYALEEDFAELRYDAEDFRELRNGRILVLGMIHGAVVPAACRSKVSSAACGLLQAGVRGRSGHSLATRRHLRPQTRPASVVEDCTNDLRTPVTKSGSNVSFSRMASQGCGL